MAHIVIENLSLPESPRALVATDALPQWEGRGWVAVGGCSEPSRDPIRTDTEFAADQAAESKRIAALLKSDVAPASSRPSK